MSVYGVPYSEHSSFPELRDCVARLRPKRLVPTVRPLRAFWQLAEQCEDGQCCGGGRGLHLGSLRTLWMPA